MKVVKSEALYQVLPGFVLIGSTIFISPWTNYDPINIPKLLVLVTGSFMSIPFLISKSKSWRKTIEGKFLLYVSALFIVSSMIIMFTNSAPLGQQFWGTWGRSNGFLCFLGLTLTFFLGVSLGFEGGADRILRYLILAGYAVSFYALVQYMQLDPLPWSQKQPFSFLGNINFMSSFLGLVNIYLLSKALLEKLPTYTKFYYFSVILVNGALIFFTGSIQGLGVTAIGISTTLVFLLVSKSRILLAKIVAISSAILGVIILMGTGGIGPLGRILLQETVLYRTDYWRTGIEIFLRNPWDGVGLDSLGDYYREYRDVLAATRTGPQRIVNTSHNVIIDLFANGGFFVGITFTVLALFSVFILLNKSIRPTGTSQMRHLSSLVLGWAFFMLVSINQIGVTVWGFAFLGLGVGLVILESGKNGGKTLKLDSARGKSAHRFGLSISFGIVGLLFVSIPLRVDSLVLSAVKSGDVEKLKSAVSMLGASGFHQDKYLEIVSETQGQQNAVIEARRLLQFDPRNLYAWSIIFSAEEFVSETDRKVAIEAMLSLDPNNIFIQNDYRLVVGSLPLEP